MRYTIHGVATACRLIHLKLLVQHITSATKNLHCPGTDAGNKTTVTALVYTLEYVLLYVVSANPTTIFETAGTTTELLPVDYYSTVENAKDWSKSTPTTTVHHHKSKCRYSSFQVCTTTNTQDR
jgi:hypothetical protein